jgi:hypothetical protein
LKVHDSGAIDNRDMRPKQVGTIQDREGQINMSSEIDLLLDVIDDAYAGKSWQGPNLKGSLRGVTPEEAVWRPAPKRHNIWELVSHAAYWKYIVRRKLLDERRGSFPLKGSNWFIRPETLSADAWRKDRLLLHETHASLRRAIAALDPQLLPRIMPGSKYPYAKLIYGVAAHDIYHTGQITFIKRLLQARKQ